MSVVNSDIFDGIGPWYDAVSGKRIVPKASVPRAVPAERPETVYEQGERFARIDKLWRTIVDVSSQ